MFILKRHMYSQNTHLFSEDIFILIQNDLTWSETLWYVCSFMNFSLRYFKN